MKGRMFMINKEDIKNQMIQAVEKVKQTNPMAGSITNTVTINLVANTQIAVGGAAAKAAAIELAKYTGGAVAVSGETDLVTDGSIIAFSHGGSHFMEKITGGAVLCKGGYNINDANDLLYFDRKYRWFLGERIDNKNTHGTGCTLSSAIASFLAKGMGLETSIQLAKEYISGALRAMLDLGKGSGPLDHMWNINKEEQ